jgi:anthranilate/para-aminobenzoate synthase component II
LVIDKKTINAPLVVIASTTDGEIMAIRHEKLPWYGVQFHPESFLTVEGEVIVRNFLQIADLWYSSE